MNSHLQQTIGYVNIGCITSDNEIYSEVTIFSPLGYSESRSEREVYGSLDVILETKPIGADNAGGSPVGVSCYNQKINYREKEKQVLDQILGPTSYDARIRPSGVNGTETDLPNRAASFLPSADHCLTNLGNFSPQTALRVSSLLLTTVLPISGTPHPKPRCEFPPSLTTAYQSRNSSPQTALRVSPSADHCLTNLGNSHPKPRCEFLLLLTTFLPPDHCYQLGTPHPNPLVPPSDHCPISELLTNRAVPLLLTTAPIGTPHPKPRCVSSLLLTTVLPISGTPHQTAAVPPSLTTANLELSPQTAAVSSLLLTTASNLGNSHPKPRCEFPPFC
ncbi:Glycine receptor subunit alpha-3 [Homalodisca vitripennis]|nr:Glycine receptor subunit alpha-3 [Homalodisca vitripennis]